VERLHKTMRAEFFNGADQVFAAVPELQEALDRWVAQYNTARPHQSCGGQPPAERFALAGRSAAAGPVALPEPARATAPGRRPAGVSRWVNAHGKISLAGFSYRVGATYAGEPVEVVVAGGLVDILHAGVVVATHAQRLRDDQADRAPRARFLSRERARVWLKDVPMKEYSRARSGIGAFSDLVTVRLPSPGQIARQVLGEGWDAVNGTVREKPNRCVISNGHDERLMMWGPPKVLRDLVWAGINAIADGRQPRPLLVVAAPRGDVVSESEKRRHVRLGQIASLDVRHTVLRVTRITPQTHR
jgi:hypothetical protein